jgi:hypothetical protein
MIIVEKTSAGRERQKKILVAKKGRIGYGNGRFQYDSGDALKKQVTATSEEDGP